MGKPSRYSPEARKRAVRLVLDHQRAHDSQWGGHPVDRGQDRLLPIIPATLLPAGAARRGTKDPWLARMLARKPRMLVAVALANRRARIAWALMTKNEQYRAPAVTA